jgi:hypothetical protein
LPPSGTRTIRSKGCLSNKTALAMVFKLVESAQKNWRRIDGHNQLPKLIQGVKFTDGILPRLKSIGRIGRERKSASLGWAGIFGSRGSSPIIRCRPFPSVAWT